MKETVTSKRHLQIIKDRSLMKKVFEYHMNERYVHLVNLKDMYKAKRAGKKTIIWGLIKQALNTLPEYHELDDHHKSLCERETCRYFKKLKNAESHMREWEHNHKDAAPPVDDDYSGINAIFSKPLVTPPSNNEIDAMVSLAKEGAKTIKSPSGWIVEF